jgi:HSP20 family protein
MTNSGKIVKMEEAQELPFENILANFRQEIENAMKTWSTSPWIPSLFDYEGIRLPLCDIADRGNRYEIQVEVPGMKKENVKVTATANAIEISAQNTQNTEEKRKGHMYTERSQSSFYRLIPLPYEIVTAKVKSKVNNGILTLEAPKKRSKSRLSGT